MVLSVVLPAYNEEGAIEKVVRDHHQLLCGLRQRLDDWEIVCLDDASSDGTLAILKRLADEIPSVRVLAHARNQGIFKSFRDLFTSARGTHLYLTASDGQWPASNLVRLLEKIEDGADLVVGVRPNRNEIYNVRRRAVSFLFNLLPRVLFGVRTADAGSVKLGLREIFNFDLISRSPFVEAERIIRARRDGYLVMSARIEFLRRGAGKEGGASWHNVGRSLLDCGRCFRFYRVGGGRALTRAARGFKAS